MVLAIGKVLFQYQEVAAVFAESRGAAADGAEAVQVDYNPLPVVADPFTAKKDEVLLRTDREAKTNHIYHWEVGDKERHRAGAGRQRQAHQAADVVPALPSGAARAVRLRGASSTRWGGSTFHVTSQAPHVYRTAITHRDRHSRGQDPRRSRRTSAAASATRCRSTRATSAPSSAR